MQVRAAERLPNASHPLARSLTQVSACCGQSARETTSVDLKFTLTSQTQEVAIQRLTKMTPNSEVAIPLRRLQGSLTPVSKLLRAGKLRMAGAERILMLV